MKLFPFPLSTLAAAFALIASSAFADPGLTLPYTEDFSSGSEGLNESPLSGTLDFNNITYSVDGTGGVAIYDVKTFLGLSSLANFSGLGVIGDWQWSGSTAHNVHTFTLSTDGGVAFALASLDWATGNGGPPTVYTITGYSGITQVVQVTGVDISQSSNNYNFATGSEIDATDIGPGDNSGYGQHLVFSGSDWGNIDRVVFSSTGNDILVALDNIQLSPAAIPEPSQCAALLGLAVVGLAMVRRRRSC